MTRDAPPIEPRRFLFLQGPHGPFFARLAMRMRATGAEVFRAGFNKGDEVFWRGLPGYIPVHSSLERWEEQLKDLIATHKITDLVLYGTTRPIHVVARRVGTARGLKIHAFEEGYLRPYWVTYERDGTNAQSRLNEISIAEMDAAIERHPRKRRRDAPDRWGDMRAHMFWGSVYHAALLFGHRSYPAYRPHRTPDPRGEFRLYVRRLLTMPARRISRWFSTTKIRRASFPYHVVLLQLAHDANFRDNSSFESQRQFLDLVFHAFKEGAPRHHRLVVKAHPLEDGREPLRPLLNELASSYGLRDRLHFVTGGKLAALLDRAESAVTVNSTSAEQALWRGLPLKAFGKATFARAGLISDQPLDDFFARPQETNAQTYDIYREFLLSTSQVRGGFYSSRGRRMLTRQLPDMMLNDLDPYETFMAAPEAAKQHLNLVPKSAG